MQLNVQTQCKACYGQGSTEVQIDSRDIMTIVNNHLSEDGDISKIPAIKTVRTKYGVSLKQAKDLVEGAMLFYSALQKMRDVSIDLPSAPHWTEEREDEQIAW